MLLFSLSGEEEIECSRGFQNITYILKFKKSIIRIFMNQQLVVAPIGIDLGSLTSKIAVAKRGGVEVITN